MNEAAAVRMQIVDHRGAPLPGTRVIQIRAGIRMEGHADASGSIEIPVSTDGRTPIYVIPRDGSFAIADLEPGSNEAVVRVPEGASRIVIRAESDQHVPIPNLGFVIRHNGRVLPFEIVEAIAVAQGTRPKSDAGGQLVLARVPAGIYELWPVGSPAEYRALADGIGPEPPVRLVAAAGENVAVMTFEPAGNEP
jgi:hypothetical protein